MGTYFKFKTNTGLVVNINTDQITQYTFVHASPNSNFAFYTNGPASLIFHLIPEADARAMEKNLTKVLKVMDLNTMSSQ